MNALLAAITLIGCWSENLFYSLKWCDIPRFNMAHNLQSSQAARHVMYSVQLHPTHESQRPSCILMSAGDY